MSNSQSEKLTALVPVRKGSERVVNKNIRPFAGSSLLELKISILKKITKIDEIIVNSDCDAMLSIAKNMGVSTHKREEHYASSKVNNSEYFEHIAKNTNSENIMYSPVTCPLIKVATYYDTIEKFHTDNKYDSLVTAFPVKQHMWLDGEPTNYDPENSPNTQNLPNILGISYGVSIISKKLMIKRRNVVGYNPLLYELNETEAVDIDTELEFKFAEFLYKQRIYSPKYPTYGDRFF